MKVAMAQHDALLRRVCDPHAGYVFKTVTLESEPMYD
jgi:hypothetical protein